MSCIFLFGHQLKETPLETHPNPPKPTTDYAKKTKTRFGSKNGVLQISFRMQGFHNCFPNSSDRLRREDVKNSQDQGPELNSQNRWNLSVRKRIVDISVFAQIWPQTRHTPGAQIRHGAKGLALCSAALVSRICGQICAKKKS